MSVGDGSASGTPGERRFNTEDVSRQLLRLLQPLHVDSLSLHDPSGKLLWLNEGAFGPDEHGVLMDALDVFALDSRRADLRLQVDKDRTALFACARDAGDEVCGVALAIVETPDTEEFSAKFGGPSISSQMRRFAQLLAPPPPQAAVVVTPRRPVDAAPVVNAAAPVNAAPAVDADATVVAAALDIAMKVSPRVERRLRSSNKNLSVPVASRIHARRYARLRAGGSARRYEVKPAPDASFASDLALALRVVEHVKRAGERYTQTPSSFAVPLSLESIQKPGWIEKLQPALPGQAPNDLIGFSLPRLAWDSEPEACEKFIADCERAKCFVALDDFTLGSHGLRLLRSSAVRCLKLEPTLISTVIRDKFAQATLAAIVQAARVLGLYCVAKQVSSQAQVKWLAAAGIEFADSVDRGVAVVAAKTDEVPALQAGNET
jgi:hypothetical protein